MTLAWFFVGLAAAFLLLAIYATWQSLRAAFGVADLDDVTFGAIDEDDARRRLEDEKAAVLRNIKDLGFERDAGKIGEEDFRRQDEQLRGRAKEILRLLDEGVESYRDRAKSLIAERLASDAKTPYRGGAKGAKGAKGAAPTRDCGACGTANDDDAGFCKRCGKPLEMATAETAAEPSAEVEEP